MFAGDSRAIASTPFGECEHTAPAGRVHVMKLADWACSKPALWWSIGGAVFVLVVTGLAVTAMFSARAELDALRHERPASSPRDPVPTVSLPPAASSEPSPIASEDAPGVVPEPVQEPAPAPIPAPSPVPPPLRSPVCPSGQIVVTLSYVESRMMIPSNTGDAAWDSLYVSPHLTVTNNTDHVVSGGGSVAVIGSPHQSGSDLKAFFDSATLQPGQTIAYSSVGASMLRHKFDAVTAWSARSVDGLYFFQNVDPRCTTASMISAVLG